MPRRPLLPSHPSLTFSASNTAVSLDLEAVPGGAISLPPGTYWMSFYPALNFADHGQWFWDVATTANGQNAKVIDPFVLIRSDWRNWDLWTDVYADGFDAAFRLEGKSYDTGWLSETPVNGLVPSGQCTPVDVTLDAGALAPGDYSSGLFLSSNDPGKPYFYASVNMTVKAGTYGVTMSPPADALSGHPGETATYYLHVTNTGNFTNTFTIAASGNLWTVTIPVSVVTLGANESADVVVNVAIPAGASNGDADSVTITVTGAGGASDVSVLATTADTIREVYLPVVKRP